MTAYTDSMDFKAKKTSLSDGSAQLGELQEACRFAEGAETQLQDAEIAR